MLEGHSVSKLAKWLHFTGRKTKAFDAERKEKVAGPQQCAAMQGEMLERWENPMVL